MEDIDAMFGRLSDELSSASPSSQRQRNFLDDLATRLRALRRDYAECMQISDRILEMSRPMFNAVRWDDELEAFVQDIDGEVKVLVKFERKDPKVPIAMTKTARAVGGQPGKIADTRTGSKEIDELAIVLTGKVEAFYEAASRWWRSFETEIRGRTKPAFIGIQMVRNKLIAHPEKTFADSEHGYMNSFTARDDVGPTLKNMRYAGQTNEFQDLGLRPNAVEMISSALKHFDDLRAKE